MKERDRKRGRQILKHPRQRKTKTKTEERKMERDTKEKKDRI